MKEILVHIQGKPKSNFIIVKLLLGKPKINILIPALNLLIAFLCQMKNLTLSNNLL